MGNSCTQLHFSVWQHKKSSVGENLGGEEVYAATDCSSPWGAHAPATGAAPLHVLLFGTDPNIVLLAGAEVAHSTVRGSSPGSLAGHQQVANSIFH